MKDDRELRADERESTADEREDIADERDRLADDRGHAELAAADPGYVGSFVELYDQRAVDRSADAVQRRHRAERAERTADSAAGRVAGNGDWVAERREFVADDRQAQADVRQDLADETELRADRREEQANQVGVGATASTIAAGHASRAEAATARDAAALARRIADRDRAGDGSAHPLAAEFVKMARSLLQAETADLAMADVVDAAVRFVNGCDAASFSAYVDDIVTTLASTSLVADELDAAQIRTSEGPCLQAIRTLQLVISADLAQDERWPTFAAIAPQEIKSVMSAPVSEDPAAGPSFGSLNNYSEQANAFDGEDADTAILLTAHLGVLLRLASITRESTDRTVQLSDAIESRDVIGQAKGILMERERLTAAQAFDVLRAASQRLNRKLRDVADDLASSGELAARPPTAPDQARPAR